MAGETTEEIRAGIAECTHCVACGGPVPGALGYVVPDGVDAAGLMACGLTCLANAQMGRTFATAAATATTTARDVFVPDARDTVLSEIAAERERQIAKFGPAVDANHTPATFAKRLNAYVAWAETMHDLTPYGEKYRRRMVQVAALAVAAVEHCDNANGRK